MRSLLKEILANPVAMFLAILVHMVLGGILFVSLEWTDVATPVQPEVDIVKAVAIDEKKIKAELDKIKKAEARKKKKQRKLDKKARDAEKKRKREEKKLAKLRKEREAEKKRSAKEQAKKKKELERLKVEQATLERKRIEEEKRLEDAALESKRREDKKRREAEAKAMQAAIAAEQAALEKANQKRLSSLRGQYIADIQNKVQRKWLRPASAKQGLSCKVVVNQIPGGEVINVTTIKCTGDAIFRRSVEAAVYKASPLPRPSDPRLFDREIVFTFKPKH